VAYYSSKAGTFNFYEFHDPMHLIIEP